MFIIYHNAIMFIISMYILYGIFVDFVGSRLLLEALNGLKSKEENRPSLKFNLTYWEGFSPLYTVQYTTCK